MKKPPENGRLFHMYRYQPIGELWQQKQNRQFKSYRTF
jgi:hypothetical protein